jgi:hypothetical protein
MAFSMGLLLAFSRVRGQGKGRAGSYGRPRPEGGVSKWLKQRR